MRDSAEKAWNAAVQAANALALNYTGFILRSHYERRRALRQVEEKVPELARLSYDRYAARSRLLHGEVFYEGILDADVKDRDRQGLGVHRDSQSPNPKNAVFSH